MAVFGRTNAAAGQIIDISKGGLAFVYVAEKEASREASEIDILLTHGLSHLYGLPCETVYDFQTDSTKPSASVIERRRGVKFGELTRHQEVQLDHFLKTCTRGEVEENASIRIPINRLQNYPGVS
jgi:hypothetical protein